MPQLATVVIAARNAGETIHRAVTSATAQADCPIVLVDDFSADDTVVRARKVAGGRIKIVCLPRHETLGVVRQAGLIAVETPYGVWLDADDELLPGRVDRLIEAMVCEDAEVASDGVELYDGPAGTLCRALPIPAFLRGLNPLARLFERNYLPGIGVIGFRTEFARSIGYDALLQGAEDIDFVLRTIAAGARVCLLDSIGYRQYAYPSSVSRNIENQKKMYRRALLKHEYDDVRRLYFLAGLSDRITAWGLTAMAIFREEYGMALGFISEAEKLIEDPMEVLEPGGPCPMPEGWRVHFHKGTVLLLAGELKEAVRQLEEAEAGRPTAEGANNLGIAKWKMGNTAEAEMLFLDSLDRFPDFLDAKTNLSIPAPDRVTTHTLRTVPCRNHYPLMRA